MSDKLPSLDNLQPATEQWTEALRQRKKQTYDLNPDGAKEAQARKRERVLKHMINNRKWLTNDMALKLMEIEGYESDLWTIPLKDAKECPLRLFEGAVEWEDMKDDRKASIRTYIQRHGELPDFNQTSNMYAWFIKHQDPRKLFFNVRTGRFNPHQAKMYLYKPTLISEFSKIDLWDQGFWLYKVLLVQVGATPIQGLHIKDIQHEDVKEKNRRHATSFGSNYYFRIVCSKTGEILTPDRHGKLHWNVKWRTMLWQNRANAIRDYKELPRNMKRKSAVLIRYRGVLGKPYPMISKEQLKEDMKKWWTQSRKLHYDKYMQHMVDIDDWKFHHEYLEDDDG